MGKVLKGIEAAASSSKPAANEISGSSAFFYNFAKESMERNGYVVLALRDIDEVSNSKVPSNHIVAIKFVSKTNSLLIVDGDYRTLSVPVFNVPLIGCESPPDFSKITLEDLGLTVIFGSEKYKVDAHVLFAAEDPTFLDRLKKTRGV